MMESPSAHTYKTIQPDAIHTRFSLDSYGTL